MEAIMKSKTIKVGDTVISGDIRGEVVEKYKEPCGYYYLYEVRDFTTGKVWVVRYAYHD
jgi:hypothetical protein